MYIDKEFAKSTNTKWEALKLSCIKRSVGEKMWFLHQYCVLTGREPELLKMLEEIKENNVEFATSSKKVRIGTGFCYGWESTYYVMSIDITDEQYQEILAWYRRIHARKDSLIVDENINSNTK